MQEIMAINFFKANIKFTKIGQVANKEFEDEMKIISLLKLYELGKISSGFAAKLLNITRIDFLELLGKYNVSYFHKGIENELESDYKNT